MSIKPTGFEKEIKKTLSYAKKCTDAKKSCEASFLKYMVELATDLYSRYFKIWKTCGEFNTVHLEIRNAFGYRVGSVRVNMVENEGINEYIAIELTGGEYTTSRDVDVYSGKTIDGKPITRIGSDSVYNIPKIIDNVEYFTSGQFRRDFEAELISRYTKKTNMPEFYKEIEQKINRHTLQLRNDGLERTIDGALG